MREALKPLPDDNILTVTCGHLKGYLHRDRFFCPGIHRECIEVDGIFVTPKRFSVMGEKERLKDWKNAVRLNGVQLRRYIESGLLTFSNHDTLCTGRCIARAPGSRTGPAANLVFTLKGQEVNNQNIGMVTTLSGNDYMKIENVETSDSWTCEGEEPKDVKPDLNELQMQMLQTQYAGISKGQKASTSVAGVAVTPPPPQTFPTYVTDAAAGDAGSEDISEEDFEDRLLWKGIVELGLVDEFFREIKASLDVLKNGMVRRHVPIADSRKISVIVKQLGLMQKLKYKLEAHQTDMERQRMKLDREMEELQRKVREFEAKKAVLKRKSECFEQLLDITAPKVEVPWADNSVPPAYKRVCINPLENGGKQLIVFPQQMIQNTDSAETLARSPNGGDGRSEIIKIEPNLECSDTLINSDSASPLASEAVTKSTSVEAYQSGSENSTALNYVTTMVRSKSTSPSNNHSKGLHDSDSCDADNEQSAIRSKAVDNSNADHQDEVEKERDFTAIKVKLPRIRKRKPKEVPRLDPEELESHSSENICYVVENTGTESDNETSPSKEDSVDEESSNSVQDNDKDSQTEEREENGREDLGDIKTVSRKERKRKSKECPRVEF